MAKIGGKISAAIAKVLSSIGIEAEIGAAVGTIIGSLEDHMKDKSVIGLGRYKVCTDIHEAMVRKYEEIVSVSFIKE